jgi:hypothetical protein
LPGAHAQNAPGKKGPAGAGQDAVTGKTTWQQLVNQVQAPEF